MSKPVLIACDDGMFVAVDKIVSVQTVPTTTQLEITMNNGKYAWMTLNSKEARDAFLRQYWEIIE